jgi:1,4-dihydroxy-2-naphthoyl-CoA hydrolase
MKSELWFDRTNIRVDLLNECGQNTLSEAIGLEITEVTEQSVLGKLQVSSQNCQPLGLLNGGTSMAIIEILGSVAANLTLDRQIFVAVGQSIQGSHFRPAKLGEWVFAAATPLHVGKKSQVWEVSILNSEDKLVCKGSITMAVITLNNGK